MMTSTFSLALVLAAGLSFQAGEPAEQTSEPEAMPPAHIHIKHVLETVNGPPDQVGYLTILEEEAQIARRHAELAAADPADLEAMKTHVHHVRHAVDPSTEEKGPGKGFGLLRSAKSVESKMKLAVASEGSTENIERHSTHVATSAGNVVRWAEAILAESEKVLAAETAEAAAPSTQRIAELTRFILEGHDADEDGQVSWQQGEGGIPQARQHAELMAKGEGLTF